MKKYLSIAIALLIATMAFAGVYTIGTGTIGSYTVPFNGLWDNNWSKVIYTKTEINAAGLTAANSITGIAFNVTNTPSNYTMLDQRVYVRHTSAALYEDTDIDHPNSALFDAVYQGDLTYNGSGWFSIAFSTPFAWNGTDNIEFLFENHDGGWTSGYPNFAYTSTSPNYLTAYKAQDSSFPQGVNGERSYNRPNIQLYTPMVDPPNPTVAISPANGASFVNAAATLNWTSLIDATGYKLYFGNTNPPAYVGDLGNVTTYNPNGLADGSTYYWQVIPYNAYGDASNCPIWSFTTTPAGTVVIGDGTATSRFPLGSYYGYERSASLYTATEIGAGNKRINTLGWFTTQASSDAVPTKIYLKSYAGSTVTADSWANLTAGATPVYDATISSIPANGWYAITLTNTFDLDSGNNLLVLVERNFGGGGGSAGSTAPAIRATTMSGMHHTVLADSNPPTDNTSAQTTRPNLMLLATSYTISDPPNPAIAVSPVDQATGVLLTATLNWVSGGGAPDGYKLYFGNSNPPAYIGDMGDALSYNPTLAYSNTYYWQVIPYNNQGDAANCPIWSFSTLADPTISSFPFFEGFESGYTNGASVLGSWTQLVGPEYETQYWTASNNQTTYNRPPRTGNWNATLRYNGESTLVRPIQLEAGTDYQIEFYARQDTDTSTAAKIQAKLGNAPTLAALTTEITPQTGLVSGDYQKVSGTFSVDVDGIYYIGIHGWLNITPWYISMDDIAIREMISGPPATPTLTYPNDVATDMSVYGFNLTWEPDLDNGGLPTYYAVFMSQDEETIYDDHYFEVDDPFFNPVTDSEGAIVFAYEDRWFWTVVAGNLDGESDPATVRSFQIEADPAITSFPWCEGFEGNTFPPAGWTMVDDDGDGENWYQFSVDPHTGNYSATSASYINYVGELYPDNWLITPPLAIPATGDYMVEYYVASQDPDWPEEHYGFYVSTSGPAIANFTMLSQETLEDGDWHQRSNPLASYAGQTVHFAFRHFNSTDNYMMKIDDVCVREIPQAPMLSITPTEFDFGTTHTFTPTTPKTFTLSNIGIGTIDVGVGDIWLTDDIEGNFVLDTQDLPVEISGTEPYNFTVQFIAQSAGFKSATLNIQDNITRAIHTVALTGEAVEEPIASVIMLEGELYGADAAYIDWASIYGDPTQTGYLHWDDSLDRGAVGAGANQYHAAVMFGSEVMEHTVGQVLDGVMIHLNEEPQTVDYLKVWSGTDADIAPETLLATEAVSGLTVGWNYIPLTTPVPTTGIEALWVGYHVNGIAGTFPGSTDGLYGVDGRGNLVELDDEWFTLEDAGIEGNWLIHAHFTDEAKYLTSRRTPTLTPKTTHAQVKNQKDMRDLPLAAIQTVEMNRVLRGFNIFRDNVQINTTTVAAYYYTDENLAPGTYYYSVQSVHDSTNGPISYEVPVTIPEPPAPFALPFTEDWSAGMEENWWTAGGTNWNIDSSTGNPAPSARFYWSPRVYDYNIPLTSYSFDATGLNTVTLKFDLFLSNYSPTIENNMAWEVWDGSVWNRIDERSSLNGSFGWTTLSYNISEYAANGVFKIRFVAEGVDSYQINYWYIDNISLYSLPESLDPVTDLSVSKSGSDFILDWTAVEGAQWYAIYTSDDPYTGFTFAYLVESAGDLTIPASMLGSDKLFVRITAGAGDTPPLPAKRN